VRKLFTTAYRFGTVPRLMTRLAARMRSSSRVIVAPVNAIGSRLGAFAVLLAIATGLAGCQELSARRLVQKGNEEYGEQHYEAAAAKFEAAIKKAPDLQIAHHNLGITYSRMFKPGVETDENRAIASKAAEQFAYWLDKHPNDTKIRKLLTGIWLDAGEYQKALDFWKKEHDKDPKAQDVIELIAGIYNKSGDWRSAIEWYYKDVEAAKDVDGKVLAYQSVTNLTFARLFSGRDKLFGVDRTELAEIGLAAAGEALKLDSKSIPMWGISTGLWNNRAIANGPGWAQAIDRAEAQVFDQTARVLKEEAKKAQAATGTPGAPATPANGT
jgi:tetratricopeptide (TPR) repeat protein